MPTGAPADRGHPHRDRPEFLRRARSAGRSVISNRRLVAVPSSCSTRRGFDPTLMSPAWTWRAGRWRRADAGTRRAREHGHPRVADRVDRLLRRRRHVAALQARSPVVRAAADGATSSSGASLSRAATDGFPGGPKKIQVGDLKRNRLPAAHPSTFLVKRLAIDAYIGLVDEQLPGELHRVTTGSSGRRRGRPILSVREATALVRWHKQSYFVERWEMIDEALAYLVAKTPEALNHVAGPDPRAASLRPSRVRTTRARVGDVPRGGSTRLAPGEGLRRALGRDSDYPRRGTPAQVGQRCRAWLLTATCPRATNPGRRSAASGSPGTSPRRPRASTSTSWGAQ